jgi:glycosyltransferase involved in cell wall biosynthesis
MRVGIFVGCAGRQDGGPETYERNLVRNIAEADRENEYHVFCLGQGAADSFAVRQDNVRFHVLWPANRWVSVPVSLPVRILRERVPFFHATVYPPPLSPVDLVFTMHDVSPFVHPEFFPPHILRRLSPLVRTGVRSARLVICGTEHARETTLDCFKIPPERVVVIPHGVDARFVPMRPADARRAVRRAFDLTGPYVLYLGKLMDRKNVVRLIEAFHAFREERRVDATLVLAGRRFYDPVGIDETIERRGLREHVRELGYVPDALLPALYGAAEMNVYPTLWEGFGMPVVEAMACGTPVITSNNSCLPEIAGGAALLVDPYSVESISDAIGRLFGNEPLRQELRAKGLRRAACFNWAASARRTIAAYRALADGQAIPQ